MLYFLFGCFLLSLVWALRWPMTKSLMVYSAAQALYVPFVGLAWLILGNGKMYGVFYSFFTAIILVTVGHLSWEGIWNAKYKGRTLAVSLLLVLLFAKKAVVGIARPMDWFDIVLLIEGSMLFWGSLVVGISANLQKFENWSDIARILSMFWLAQAVVNFGVLLHYPGWNDSASYVSPILGIVAFLILGWRLKRKAAYGQGPLRAR